MCKNADNPCPGCKKHKKIDPVWMFFSDEEREVIQSTKDPASDAAPRS